MQSETAKRQKANIQKQKCPHSAVTTPQLQTENQPTGRRAGLGDSEKEELPSNREILPTEHY